MSDGKTTSESGGGAPQAPAGRPAAGRSRRIMFRLGAVFAGLLPFLMLEIGLRVLGLGRPTDSPDADAGFGRSVPLFERQGAVYRTTRARFPLIAPQEFPVAKPQNGFRVFCFGGSTVYGHPYLGDTAFPKWLEMELAGSDPTRTWQVINCGGISYASYRIEPMAKEVLQYQPDLIILATGHNEFLEDRTYQPLKSRPAAWAWLQDNADSLRIVGLARRWVTAGQTGANRREAATGSGDELNTRLDNPSGYASYHRDDAWHQSVIAQFDSSVRRIVTSCRAAGVPILLVKLGANLRDCPPFKSEHRPGLPPEQESGWQAAFDAATVAETNDLAQALELYRKAEAIDGEYALLEYRIARTLDRMDRKSEAKAYYQKARDDDVCPLRIITPFEQSLSRIAAETGTPLVDAASLLAARSPDNLPGFDWYVDHVHPTIGGHQLIARTLAAQMRDSGMLARSAVWPEAERLATYAHHLERLSPAYFADGKRRVDWLEEWANRQRLAAETLPKDARGYVRVGFRRLDLGEDDAAWQALSDALTRDRGVTNLIREHAQELIAEGRPERGAALLRKLN